MGLFIVFEGGEGAGKSTHIRHLYGLLSQHGYRSKFLREPGGTALGEYLRPIVALPRQALVSAWGRSLVPPQPASQLASKELWVPLSVPSELFLFLASRAQLVQEVIRPALAKGTTILCDRFTHSTLAYQGYARGLELDMLRHLNHIATGGLEPDLIVLLDLEPSQALARKRRGGDLSRFEEEEMEFHRRVRQGYLDFVRAEPQRWLVVDSSQPRQEVARAIWERVKAELDKAGINPQEPRKGGRRGHAPAASPPQQGRLGSLEGQP